jgi:hypothetical protein
MTRERLSRVSRVVELVVSIALALAVSTILIAVLWGQS